MFTRLVLPSALAVSLVLPAFQSQRSIIVTVLDQSGAPVKTVAPGDLAVAEDDATREVVEIKPAADPMTIAILVDNTKAPAGKDAPTRELRAALTTFVNTVHAASPESAIGLWEFAGAGVMIQKPTTKTEDLTKKINRMFPSQQSAGVMLEALVDASKELSRKEVGPRRIIVALSLNSSEVSTIEPRDVAIAMRKAGVNFWAVSIAANADASGNSQGGAATREVIMDNVTTATGGLRLTGVTAVSLEAQVKRIADALTSQYLVTYARPANAPSTVTNVQTMSKKGMKALTGPWMR